MAQSEYRTILAVLYTDKTQIWDSRFPIDQKFSKHTYETIWEAPRIMAQSTHDTVPATSLLQQN
jgi:hypothetical protein